MNYKWIGAIFILASCGGFGFSIAGTYQRELRILRQMVYMTELMQSELTCRLTPLPELCRKTGKSVGGLVRRVLYGLAQELERQICPDVPSCMHSALASAGRVPRSAERIFNQMGSSLGQYDLTGQLKGLDSVKASCCRVLQRMEQNREVRLRSYRTLGICAGAALVILFI